MKKIKLLLVIFLLLLVSGCYKYSADFKINDDKSVNLNLSLEIQKDDVFSEDDYSSQLESYINEAKLKGYETTYLSEESIIKVNASKTFTNIDEITAKEKVEVDLFNLIFLDEIAPKSIVETKELFSSKDNKTYQGNFTFPNYDDSGEKNPYGKATEIKFNITLPNKPKSNNADSISKNGKTLTWILNFGEDKNIDFVFDFEKSSLLVYIIIGILLIVLITVFIIKKLNNRKPATEKINNKEEINEKKDLDIERPSENLIPNEKPEPAIIKN